jgi:hypothetical protein
MTAQIIALHPAAAVRSEVLARIVRARLLLADVRIAGDEAVSEALEQLDARLGELAGMVGEPDAR